MELWSLLHFLMPSVFASHAEFKEWFSNPLTSAIERQQLGKHTELVGRLHQVLRPFLLRRLKRDVEKQMPNKYEHVLKAPLSRRQRILYDEFLHSRDSKDTLERQDYLGLMNILMQLRKVCNHPNLFEARPVKSPLELQSLELPVPGSVLEMAQRNFQVSSELNQEKSFFPGSVLLGLALLHFELNGNQKIEPIHFPDEGGLQSRTALQTFRSSLSFLPREQNQGLHATSLIDKLTVASFNDLMASRQKESRNVRVGNLLLGYNRLRDWQPIYGKDCIAMCRVRGGLGSGGTAVGWREHWEFDEDRRGSSHQVSPKAGQVHFSRNFSQSSCSWLLPSVFPALFPKPAEIGSKTFSAFRNFQVLTTRAMAPPIQLVVSRGLHNKNRLMRDMDLPGPGRPPCSSNPGASIAIAARPFGPMLLGNRLGFPEKQLLLSDCGKFRVLAPLLRKLHTEGHKVILFTQMSKMLDVLESFVNTLGFTYVRLDGSTKVEKRQAVVDQFQKNKRVFMFLASTRSGGVGINLTAADCVIFYDSDWNQAMDKQAVDRAHRIGQTRDVHIYRLISEATVEENIFKKQLQKRELDEVVVDGGRFDEDGKKWTALDLVGMIDGRTKLDDQGFYGTRQVWAKQEVGSLVESSGPSFVSALAAVEDLEDTAALQQAMKENHKAGVDEGFVTRDEEAFNRLPGIVKAGVRFIESNFQEEQEVEDSDNVEVELSGWESEDEDPAPKRTRRS